MNEYTMPLLWRQVLLENGVTLTCEGTEFRNLLPIEHMRYERGPPQMILMSTGSHKEPVNAEEAKEIGLEMLHRLGYCVQKYHRKIFGFKKPKPFYKIAKRSRDVEAQKNLPQIEGKKHYILWHEKRGWLKGIGIGFTGSKAIFVNEEEEEEQLTPENYGEDTLTFYKHVMMKLRGEEIPLDKSVPIKEMIIGTDDKGDLYCFKKTKDAQVGLIVGRRGGAKSFWKNTLIGQAHRSQGICCMDFNDDQSKTGSLVYPSDTILKMGNQENPDEVIHVENIYKMFKWQLQGMPYLYIHPYMENMGMPPKPPLHAGKAGCYMSLPFEKIIRNASKYFDLGNSKKFFVGEVETELSKCETKEELFALLDRLMEEKVIPEGSVKKIRGELNQLIANKIVDIASPAQSTWTYQKDGTTLQLNPFLAASISGIIPSLVTTEIKGTDYWPQYLVYIITDLFEKQMTNPYFLKQKFQFLIFIDEMRGIFRKKVTTIAREPIFRIPNQGRNSGIGLWGVFQSWSVVPEELKDNATDVIHCKGTPEPKEFRDRFGIPEELNLQLSTLKTRQALIATTEGFVIYKRNGRREESNKPAIVTLLPPYAKHSPPSERLGMEEEEDKDE